MSRNSAVFRERHSQLIKYLASSIREFEARQTSTAMQRIARLPMEQFYDVSTDLHDELDRRLNNPDLPFLPIRNDLVPKRNQARQKMATLNEQRFKELAYELMVEIENRFPEVLERQVKESRHSPRSQYPESQRDQRNENSTRERDNRQAQTRPTKSERVPDRTSRNRSRSKAREDRGIDVYSNTSGQQDESDQMQKEYEFKITMLEKKIKEKDERIKDARKTEDELERLEQDYNELKEAHSLLEKDYKSLQMEADDLAQDATKLVQQRKEYDSLMADYKKLKLENEDLALCVKTAENDVIRVQSELNISKNEHQMLLKDIQILKEKMRLAEAEKESYILQNERSQKKMERNIPLHTPISGGTVNESLTLNAYDDPEFERYQQVSSKLLAASKSEDPSSVLPLMREILLACKAISQSCERKQDNPSTSPEDKDNMENAMARFSERLGSLMKAAKAHASEGSSKTEEAIALETKKLTFSISDVYEFLKAEDNKKPSARVDSVRSKRETLRTDANTIQPFTLPELQSYLRDQLDFIIQADKDLVSALTSSSPDTAADLLNEISKTIESVIVETRDTIDTSKDPKFTNAVVYDCDDIIKVLGDISNEILDLSDEKIDKPSDRRVNDKIHIAVDDLKKVTFI